MSEEPEGDACPDCGGELKRIVRCTECGAEFEAEESEFHRALAAGKIGRPKALTEDQAEEARRLRGEGKSYSEIAEELGVSKATAYRAVNEDE